MDKKVILLYPDAIKNIETLKSAINVPFVSHNFDCSFDHLIPYIKKHDLSLNTLDISNNIKHINIIEENDYFSKNSVNDLSNILIEGHTISHIGIVYERSANTIIPMGSLKIIEKIVQHNIATG